VVDLKSRHCSGDGGPASGSRKHIRDDGFGYGRSDRQVQMILAGVEVGARSWLTEWSASGLASRCLNLR
jgi:hypothetical protein